MTTTQREVLYHSEGLSKIYYPPYRWFSRRRDDKGQVIALQNVSLEVYRGEFLCIVGRSGEGKSTLLQLLGGLDEPTSGSLAFEGKPLRQHGLVAFRRKRVGFIFQMFYLLPYKSALDNVALGLTVAGTSRREARKEAMKWLTSLGLKDRIHHLPDELSGGEQQRVAIARAVIKRPDVLLADEPTGNLDKTSRVEVLNAIKTLNTKVGITVVMVTHNQDDATQYGDRVILIDGRTVATSRAVGATDTGSPQTTERKD